MSLITRTYHFTDGTVAYGSQVESEIANIVNTINSLDAASTTWTNVKVTSLLPQADVNMGGHQLTSLAAPSVSGNAAVYPITASQITSGTITNTQLATGVAAANLGTGGVTTSLLAANAVTQYNNANSGVPAWSSGTTLDTVTITTTGGPVIILATASVAVTTSGGTANVRYGVSEDNSAIAGGNQESDWSGLGGNPTIAFAIATVSSPAAGSHTYKAGYSFNSGGAFSSSPYHNLVVFELKR